jgi:hypothetical protein
MVRKLLGLVASVAVVVAFLRLAAWMIQAPTLEALGVAFGLAVVTYFVRV